MSNRVSCAFEIMSFFLVTLELYGKRRVQRLAIRFRDRTKAGFARFQDAFFDDEIGLWAAIRLGFVILLFAAVIWFCYHEIRNAHMWYSQLTWRGKQNQDFWVIFNMPATDLIGFGVIVLVSLPIVGFLLCVFAITIFYLLSKFFFWRSNPQGGFVLAGTVLFLGAKIIEMFS